MGIRRYLRQVKGVGPITALAYVLTLENPQRFVQSRDVGPYLGLVPKQEDSGESQPQLGISKAGDTMVRKLLVGSAQYILGPFGPDTDLRRYGLRLCERGGKGEWRSVRAALCDVGADRGGSLAGQGKEAESERTIATRFVVEGRARVDEARARVDPGGLADNDIHRLVRVTA